MKKTFVLVLVLFSVIALNAQTNKILFGVKGGLNLSKTTLPDNPMGMTDLFASMSGSIISQDNAMNASFNVGFIADIPLGTPMFSFQPALTLSNKPYEHTISTQTDIPIDEYTTIPGTVALNMFYKPYYLDLQTNFVYNYNINDNFRLFFGAGPYLAVSLGGRVDAKATVSAMGISVDALNTDYPIDYSSGNAVMSTEEESLSWLTKMNRLDVGANIIVGTIISNKFLLSANYQFGMVNLHKSVDVNLSSVIDGFPVGIPSTVQATEPYGKNSCFSLSVGIMF